MIQKTRRMIVSLKFKPQILPALLTCCLFILLIWVLKYPVKLPEVAQLSNPVWDGTLQLMFECLLRKDENHEMPFLLTDVSIILFWTKKIITNPFIILVSQFTYKNNICLLSI